MVALVKMAAISITIHGGFRGGFIFPFFLTGRLEFALEKHSLELRAAFSG